MSELLRARTILAGCVTALALAACASTPPPKEQLAGVTVQDALNHVVFELEGHPGSIFFYLNTLQKYQYDWIAAAVLMSLELLGSSAVTTLLIPPHEFHVHAGKAEGRALAYLAHQLLGTEEGRGFRQLMEQLPRERLIIAVGGVATMQRAIAALSEENAAAADEVSAALPPLRLMSAIAATVTVTPASMAAME